MSNFTVISDADLNAWLEEHQAWSLANDEVFIHLEFENFVEAFGFISRVAILAEKQNHHPRLENVYNKVKLFLSTHDAGNKITTKDLELAEAIERLK